MSDWIEKHPYLSIAIAWLFIYVLHLGVLYPNIMEARNFITAREMLVDGNWLLTTMDGLPRYEKPPLPTWLVALSGEIFGLENMAALRLPSALITLLLMSIFFKFCEKLTQHRLYALIATLVLSTSFFIIFAGRNGTWDIFAHALMCCGIYYLFQFFEKDQRAYTHALLAGLFIGLSFMSKGPVSHYALLLPFLIAYACVYNFRNYRGKWLPTLLVLVVIGILSSWWAYYIYMNDVADATRIAEKESSRWLDYEVKPFYYYWSFFTQSGIWTLPAFVALLYPYLKSRVIHLKAYQFALLWTLASVVLLSCIPTKKSRYLLPVLIPLACTIGFYVEYLFRVFQTNISKWEKAPMYFNFGLIATIGVVFPVGAFVYFGDKLDGYYLYYVLTSSGLFGIGIYMWYHLLHRRFSLVFYGTIVFVMMVVGFGFPLANAIIGNPAYNSISNITETSYPVYTLDSQSPEMVWEYGKATTHITKDELLHSELGDRFGVLTAFDKHKEMLHYLKDKYEVSYKETFDINPVDSTKSGYKDRLKADYYLVEKRE